MKQVLKKQIILVCLKIHFLLDLIDPKPKISKRIIISLQYDNIFSTPYKKSQLTLDKITSDRPDFFKNLAASKAPI